MQRARKLAPLSAVSMAVPQQYTPNYLNPAYQQFPPYQQVAPVQPQPPAQQYQQPSSEEEIGRRTFLKLIAVGIVTIAVTAGFEVFSKRRAYMPPNNPETSDSSTTPLVDLSELYTGTVIEKESVGVGGDPTFYENVCHSDDSGEPPSQPFSFAITLTTDLYSCATDPDIFRHLESRDRVAFDLYAEKKYEVKPWGGKFPAKEIFDACKFGKTVTFRKGTQKGYESEVYTLSRYGLHSVESI